MSDNPYQSPTPIDPLAATVRGQSAKWALVAAAVVFTSGGTGLIIGKAIPDHDWLLGLALGMVIIGNLLGNIAAGAYRRGPLKR